LKPRKKALMGRVSTDPRTACSWCGLNRRAQSAGLKVSEHRHEMIVAEAIVTAN
jgi:hypothetical protein